MQFELGQFKGAATSLLTAPALATVWISDGGQATIAVTRKLSTATGGGGGGSTGTYKITTATNGRGSITLSPSAASYAPGTVVTFTATPVAGQPWVGWSGACKGTATTCTLTMNATYSVTANFR
jgi:hypothetical protein